MGIRVSIRGVVLTVVIGSLLLGQAPLASAKPHGGEVAFLTAEIALTVSASTLAVINLVHASRGLQPNRGLLAAGYTLGCLSVLAGSLTLGLGELDSPRVIGWAAANLLSGALAIAFTAWGHVQQRDTERFLSIAPAVMQTRRGEPYYGVSAFYRF